MAQLDNPVSFRAYSSTSGDGHTEMWAEDQTKPLPALDGEIVTDQYTQRSTMLVEVRTENGYSMVGMTAGDARKAAMGLLRLADTADRHNGA